ncbi:hypothetical protein GCM10009017_18700 [Halarchaeum rubridurum]|uniref:Uncharacterized protein n=1 Tax=Halarchaeum rubridurum TaxID=489911 RepID=A0A830G048_9EURY|nr:hypothetical protein GCM10009017_18700 [Halarchaeum rubridurum]
MTPVVSKTLGIGIVLCYVALVSTTLYGGVVPAAEADAAATLGDRVLAAGSVAVEDAVPNAAAASVRVRAAVSLPATIGGRPYELRATNRTLVLDSPVRGVGGTASLSLPARVTGVEGTWRSDRPAVVVVTGNASACSVELREVPA